MRCVLQPTSLRSPFTGYEIHVHFTHQVFGYQADAQYTFRGLENYLKQLPAAKGYAATGVNLAPGSTGVCQSGCLMLPSIGRGPFTIRIVNVRCFQVGRGLDGASLGFTMDVMSCSLRKIRSTVRRFGIKQWMTVSPPSLSTTLSWTVGGNMRTSKCLLVTICAN